MPLLLRVTDNADGTGATAVVTGGSGSLWVERATATASSIGAYAQVGATLSGGGTVTPSGVGHYSWRVANGTGALTAGVVLQTTAAGGALWDRCCTMIEDRITALGLPSPPTILSGLWPNGQSKRSDFYACVSPTNQTPQRNIDGSFEDDRAIYPVLIQLVERIQPNGTTTRAHFMHCAERIYNEINNQIWDARVPEVLNVELRPFELLNNDSTAFNTLRFMQATAMCEAAVNRFRGVSAGPILTA